MSGVLQASSKEKDQRFEHHSQEEDSVSPHSARHACHVVSNVSHPQTSPFPKCKQPRLGELSVD